MPVSAADLMGKKETRGTATLWTKAGFCHAGHGGRQPAPTPRDAFWDPA